MSAKSVAFDYNALRMGEVIVSLQAMTSTESPSMAIGFRDAKGSTGLTSGFHFSTTAARELAKLLVEFADAADSAQMAEVAA